MVLLLVLLLAAAVCGQGEARETPELCTSKACEEIGQRVAEFMDEDENHCQDFFKFSCGGFIKSDKYPKDEMNIYLLGKTEEHLFQQLHEIFIKEPDHDLKLYQLLKNMYNLCRNKDEINKQGFEPIKKKLKDAGDWPVLNADWNSDNWKFEETEINLKREGFRYGSLIQVRNVLDNNKPQRYIIQILPGQLWMGRGDLQGHNDNYEATKAIMIDIAKKFGATDDQAHNQMGQALRFQNELAQIMQVSHEEGQGELMTIRDLSEKVPWIKWMTLLKGLMPDGMEPNEDEPVYVTDLQYLKDLQYQIDNREMEAANLMFWQAIRELIYYEALPGADSTKATLEERCSISTYERLPLAFSYFYVKKHLTDEDREEARKIVDHIQKELLQDIKILKWMDDDIKVQAEKKINNLKKVVGYPDELKNIQDIEKAYEGLILDQNNYALAILAWNKWVGDRSFKMLRKPVAETKYWLSDLFWLTTTYNSFDNTLTIPAGLLQPPYFNRQVPKYVNYAILGRIVGEHITEALINQGTNYDSEGNHKKDGWWNEFTRKEFEFRQSCFVQEYKHYKCITGQHLNSGGTVNSNMADQGAVKLAYNAYKNNFPDEKEKLPEVPGTYTTKQLFWLVGAHVWCAKMSEDSLEHLMNNHRQASPDLRVNAAYGSMKEFGEDFKCDYEDIYKTEESKGREEESKRSQKDEENKSDLGSNRDDLPTQNPLYPSTRCHLW